MTQMKDSNLDPAYLAKLMREYPPRKQETGNVFSGPVRLAFPNLFKPRPPMRGQQQADNGEGKFGCTILFPPGTNLSVFEQEWVRTAREKFPKNWGPDGKPIGLHSPFHDQAEKAYGPKPLMGYTPGAVTFNVSSQFKPQVVDAQLNPIVDESRVYPGVWAFLTMNVYSYSNLKTGVSFGLQSVMIIADDLKLAGGGSDPQKDFAGITITAQSNIVDKFASAPSVSNAAPSIMPAGGFAGAVGNLPVQPVDDISDLM